MHHLNKAGSVHRPLRRPLLRPLLKQKSSSILKQRAAGLGRAASQAPGKGLTVGRRRALRMLRMPRGRTLRRYTSLVSSAAAV